MSAQENISKELITKQATQQIAEAYVGIDIEMTGMFPYKGDCVFAIGWGYGPSSDDIIKGHVCLDLHLDFSADLLQQWKERGYEQRCFDTFWSKNLETLKYLQDGSKVKLVQTEKEMVDALQQALLDAEKKYGKVSPVTNTIAFDLSRCSQLLEKYGYHTLQFSRSGRMQRGYEINSFTMGAVGITPFDSRSKQAEKTALIPKVIKVVHDHNPENDAHYILLTFFNVVKYIEKNQ